MNRLLRGAVTVAGTLALAGGTALVVAVPSGAAVHPAAASAASHHGHGKLNISKLRHQAKLQGHGKDNSSYGASAPAGPITSPPLALASSSGPTSEIAPNVNIPGLLRTGLTYDTAGTTSAFSRVASPLATVEEGDHSFALSASQISSTCRSDTGNGYSNFIGAAIVVDGVLQHLPQHPAPDLTIPLDGGADGTLILNHQIFGPGDRITVHAVDLTFTPTSPDQLLTIASSTCSEPSTLGNLVTVDNPGNQTDVSGTPIADLTITGHDSDPGQALDFFAVGLPDGLTIENSTSNLQQAVISGTPLHAGVYTVTVVAFDETGATGSTTFTWTINNTVTVTNPGPQSATVGTAFSLAMAATDSDSSITTFTWSAVGLPAGLSINASTGVISGTPTDATGSPFSVTVTAADGTGATGSTTFDIAVTSPNTVTVTSPGNQTSSIAAGAITPLTVTVTDSAVVPPGTITCSATGLPDGLTIAESGGNCVISGTPTTAGSNSVTVTATDSTGASGTSAGFTWTITP